MTLTMVQLAPDMGRLTRWALRERVMADEDEDLGYALHAALAGAFGALAPKPFALLQRRGRGAQLLGYTPHPAQDLLSHAAAFATPDIAAAIGLDGFAAKPMPERWAAGARLGFEVRVRPMVRQDRNGDRDRSKEVDAAPPQSARGAIYQAWLSKRLHVGGADLVTSHLAAYRSLTLVLRHAADAEGKRRRHRQVGPDATFTGVLAVRDPDAFAALLARGVGRHRAFGFGMLLLRPTG